MSDLYRPNSDFVMPDRVAEVIDGLVEHGVLVPVEPVSEVHNWCFAHHNPAVNWGNGGWNDDGHGNGCIERSKKENICRIGSGSIIEWEAGGSDE
jgi:hypothetical protein